MIGPGLAAVTVWYTCMLNVCDQVVTLLNEEFSLYVTMLASMEPVIYWERKVNLNEYMVIWPTILHG